MRKIFILILLIFTVCIPVEAMEFTPPAAPDSAQDLMPKTQSTFTEDIWYILKNAISSLRPDISQAASVCAGLIAISLLVSLVKSYASVSIQATELAGTLCVGILLLKPTNAFIQLGIETVTELCEYGKLLLPVLTSAMAAEGGLTTATGLYTGTILLNTFLSICISKLLIPLVYIFLVLSVAHSAVSENILKKLKDFLKWLMTWILKITLYLFTGFLSVTGVVSGTVDAASVKATKIALSGVVPVVGGIISDASEAILVSAGVLKNAAGIYGILAMVAICVTPFLRIGIQYILLKLSGAVCGVFAEKSTVKLIEDFTTVMGFLLAMTGSVCLLHLVSTVCFMRGIG